MISDVSELLNDDCVDSTTLLSPRFEAAASASVAPITSGNEEQHQPPPVVPLYNKDDSAAITRSASIIRGL